MTSQRHATPWERRLYIIPKKKLKLIYIRIDRNYFLPGFTWCRGHKYGLVIPCDPSWFVIFICHFRFVYIWLEFDFEVNRYKLIQTLFAMILKNTTRGHKYKIYKKQCRTNIRKYNFSQRVVDTWNSLPAKVIESKLILNLIITKQ
jgi:hypothetical protein